MKKPIRIAVVAPASPPQVFRLIWKGVRRAAGELSSLDVSVDGYVSTDADSEKRLLADLLPTAPNALAVIPAVADSAALAAFAYRGIPVITFHTDAPGSLRRTYVGSDAALSGTLAAEFLAKLMGGRGVVASFPGSLATERLQMRYTAFQSELHKRAGGITEFSCPTGPDGLRSAALAVFRSGNPVDGILIGSPSVHLVAEAMEELGMEVPCVGCDNTDEVQPFLARGTVAGVIDDDPFEQGYMAVHEAFDAIAGDFTTDCRSSWVRISPRVVLSANARIPMNQAESEEPETAIGHRTRFAGQCHRALLDAVARIVTMQETDPLTGLLNRKKFEEILDDRTEKKQPLTLMMVGLNGFRQSHAGPGPQICDEVLKGIARVLRSQLRPQDICARVGEDEFAILLPETSGSGAPLAIKEQVVQKLGELVIAPLTLKLGIRFRIGMASMPEDAVNAEDLLVLADSAMSAQQRVAAIRDLSSVSYLAH